MASFWELRDTTPLVYDTELGLTGGDLGTGPPANVSAWVRTGNFSPYAGTNAGAANCNIWTSSSEADHGTLVYLVSIWTDPGTAITPWSALAATCDTPVHVWCVSVSGVRC